MFQLCVSSSNLYQKISSYYPFIDIPMFYLNYITARLSHLPARKAQSSLCQCKASPELSLLALKERKESGNLVFVTFQNNEGSVEFLPMHKLACAFAAGISEQNRNICMF